MLIQTSQLIDAPLDWAVAVCLGGHTLRFDTVCTFWMTLGDKDVALGNASWAQSFAPSTNYAQGGPITEAEGIPTCPDHPSGWIAVGADERHWKGPSRLVASLRCLVASRLGDEVNVPDPLLSRCSPTTLAALGLASQAANIRQEASRVGQ
jgi:hypothetical protein